MISILCPNQTQVCKTAEESPQMIICHYNSWWRRIVSFASVSLAEFHLCIVALRVKEKHSEWPSHCLLHSNCPTHCLLNSNCLHIAWWIPIFSTLLGEFQWPPHCLLIFYLGILALTRHLHFSLTHFKQTRVCKKKGQNKLLHLPPTTLSANFDSNWRRSLRIASTSLAEVHTCTVALTTFWFSWSRFSSGNLPSTSIDKSKNVWKRNKQ